MSDMNFVNDFFSGDAQAEKPLVEGERSKELQSLEERAKGCQRSEGWT